MLVCDSIDTPNETINTYLHYCSHTYVAQIQRIDGLQFHSLLEETVGYARESFGSEEQVGGRVVLLSQPFHDTVVVLRRSV